MAVFTANFNSGTNGNTLSAADPGDATAYSSVSVGATCSAVYSSTSAYGLLSGKFAQGGTSGVAYFVWSSIGSVTDHYGRLFINTTGTEERTFIIFWRNTGILAVRFRLKLTTGQIEVLNSASTVILTSTTSVNTGSFVRIEWHIVHSTTVGSVELKIFTNPMSTTPDETISVSSVNTGTNTNEVYLGYGFANTNTPDLYLDNIVVNDASYPGPGGVSVSPSSSASASQSPSASTSPSASISPSSSRSPSSSISPSASSSPSLSPSSSRSPSASLSPSASNSPSASSSLSISPSSSMSPSASYSASISLSPSLAFDIPVSAVQAKYLVDEVQITSPTSVELRIIDG